MPGNANSGRPRKPKSVLKLHGTLRKDRHGQRADDSALPPLGAKPDGLSPLASEFWDRIASSLPWAKQTDWPMLVGVCEWWAEWRQADSLNAKGIAWKHFSGAAAKCGLSPVDRERLSQEPKTSASDFDKDIAQHA